MLSALYPPLLQDILSLLRPRDLCSLSQTDRFFNRQTKRLRVLCVLNRLSRGWRPKDRCHRDWSGESVTMYPPGGRLLAKDVVNLAEEFERDPVLRGSRPHPSSEGGFEWQPDVVAMALIRYNTGCMRQADPNQMLDGIHCMTMRSYNVSHPVRGKSWQEVTRRLKEEGTWESDIGARECYWYERVVPAVTWRLRCYTPREKLDRAVDIMIRRGWGLIRSNSRLRKRKWMRVSDVFVPSPARDEKDLDSKR